MSDLSDIHDKINDQTTALARIEGSLSATLPHLATKNDLTASIAKHAKECSVKASGNGDSGGNSTRVIIALVAALGILTTVIVVLQ